MNYFNIFNTPYANGMQCSLWEYYKMAGGDINLFRRD